MVIFKNAISENKLPSSEGQIKFFIPKIAFPVLPQGAIGNLTGGYKWYKIIYSGNESMVTNEGFNWGIWFAFQNYHESDAPQGVYKANLLVF